ncbi:hypothetical protein J7431_11500, partial [Xanthomonas phaseoli pv. dieffenbachiae]|uniref:hypothetical protein n=1 Tax=Xanthomonas TaxID=338 RepID=UPI001ADA09D8
FRFVNTLISRSFRTLSASGPRLRAAASGEANYMPAEPIWEVFCEKFFTELPKICATPQSCWRETSDGLGTSTSI